MARLEFTPEGSPRRLNTAINPLANSLNTRYFRAMKQMPYAIGFLMIALTLGCAHPAGRPQDQNQDTLEVDHREYLTAATLFVQQSAEYVALCHQAYATAQHKLAEHLNHHIGDPARYAVVLDLDETVLDNSAYTAWQIQANQSFSYETWALWTDLAVAPEVPGAGDFLRFADSLGVTLFYISNRDTSALQPTMSNMRNLGLPQVDEAHFRLKTHTSDKTERRAAVEAAGFEIVLLIGDNLGDHHEKYDKQANDVRRQLAEDDRHHFGHRYIVLPNPLYGTWEGAVYGFNRDISDDERWKLRRDALQPFKAKQP
jgi:5'-nucleotidase (lipoprotein e(P4) family)